MQVKEGLRKAVEYLDKNFQESIELILALALLTWGLVTMVPVEFLPGSVYGYNAAKIPFGIVLAAPALFLIVTRLRYGAESYSSKRGIRRQCLLFISTAWIYLTALSGTTDPWPPRFLLFLATGIITVVCFLRLSKK